MAERVNAPPWVRYPQKNPFQPGTPGHAWAAALITANQQNQIIIEQLFRRVGGGEDIISQDITREVYAWDTTGSTEETVADLYGSSNLGAVESWDTVLTQGDTTALEKEIHVVSNGSKITLPDPDLVSEVIVINDDGQRITVEGNGNKIKVKRKTEDAIAWSTAGKSIRFLWFEEGPYWVAI